MEASVPWNQPVSLVYAWRTSAGTWLLPPPASVPCPLPAASTFQPLADVRPCAELTHLAPHTVSPLDTAVGVLVASLQMPPN